VIAVAVGLAFIVARDGTTGWRLVRFAVVAALGLGAWRIVRGRRALVSFAVAALAVPVGIGFAVPHLAKTGMGLPSIAGLLVLGGGLWSLARALRAIVHGRRRAVGVPLAAAAFVGVLVLVWTLGQAVAATNVPEIALGTRTPADAGFTARAVTFAASDGVRLSGWYAPSQNGAAVMLLHGAGSTRTAVLDHAAVLAGRGFGVLLFDARGHGRSEGRAMDFGWFGDRDIAGAVAFVKRQADVEGRIGILGLSMGGEEAIGAAATIGDLDAVVAEGATNRVAADKAWLSDAFGARGAVSQRIESLTYAFTDVLTSASPPISLRAAVADAAPRPMLLIAASSVPDEARAPRHNQAGAPGPVDVWNAPGTAHTGALRTQRAEWERRVPAFFEAALLGAD
jgi:pimeloyl-ACP methyl ester carboxylesterase